MPVAGAAIQSLHRDPRQISGRDYKWQHISHLRIRRSSEPTRAVVHMATVSPNTTKYNLSMPLQQIDLCRSARHTFKPAHVHLPSSHATYNPKEGEPSFTARNKQASLPRPGKLASTLHRKRQPAACRLPPQVQHSARTAGATSRNEPTTKLLREVTSQLTYNHRYQTSIQPRARTLRWALGAPRWRLLSFRYSRTPATCVAGTLYIWQHITKRPFRRRHAKSTRTHRHVHFRKLTFIIAPTNPRLSFRPTSQGQTKPNRAQQARLPAMILACLPGRCTGRGTQQACRPPPQIAASAPTQTSPPDTKHRKHLPCGLHAIVTGPSYNWRLQLITVNLYASAERELLRPQAAPTRRPTESPGCGAQRTHDPPGRQRPKRKQTSIPAGTNPAL